MQSINKGSDKTGGIRTRVKKMEILQAENTICPPPESMKIEVSADCNLKCSFCFHKDSKHQGLMTLGDFKKAVKIAHDENIPQVGLLFLGEPTTNPELPEMIRVAKEDYGIPYVFITTNGIMSSKMLDSIMNSKLDSLKWSINHYNRASFKNGTGVDGFDVLMQNIRRAAARNPNGIKLYASSAVYDVDNVAPEMKAFIDTEVKPHVYEHYYFKINNQGGLIHDSHFDITHCNRLPVLPCPRLFNNTYITHDLHVAMCCSAFTDDFIIGDLRKQTFQEIWNGERMQALRKAHLSGNIGNTICGGAR